MYTLWKKKEGFGGEPIMRPICLQCSTQPLLLQGCDNDNRWYCPECDYEWYKEERLPDATGTKPPEPNRTILIDEKVCITCNLDLTNEPRLEVHMCGECADRIINKGYILVKREDLQWLIEFFFYQKAWGGKSHKKLKRIKEEYNID